MWLRILDPEFTVDDSVVVETSEQVSYSSNAFVLKLTIRSQTTYCEKQLISFADQLARFVQECKSADAKNADGIKREFSGSCLAVEPDRCVLIFRVSTAMVTTATGVNHSLPWKMMHSWSIILEVRCVSKPLRLPTLTFIIIGVRHVGDCSVALQTIVRQKGKERTG
jgi:hypothetical protein